MPEPVIEEIVRSGAGRAGAIEIGAALLLEVVPPNLTPFLPRSWAPGESAVLRVAASLRAPLVLIDERRVRARRRTKED